MNELYYSDKVYKPDSFSFIQTELNRMYDVCELRFVKNTKYLHTEKFTSFHPAINKELLFLCVPENYIEDYMDLEENFIQIQGDVESFEDINSGLGHVYYLAIIRPETITYPDFASVHDDYYSGIPLSEYIYCVPNDYEHHTSPDYYEFINGYGMQNPNKPYNRLTHSELEYDFVHNEIGLPKINLKVYPRNEVLPQK